MPGPVRRSAGLRARPRGAALALAPLAARYNVNMISGDYAGITTIVSGGQTGVDRAALEVASALGLDHCGWCPSGRLAEDGTIPAHFQLRETPSREYAERTALNVRDSEATLILHRGPLQGGTELTWKLAHRYGRPVLAIDLNDPLPVADVRHWLAENRAGVLNVAGPRESSSPGIGNAARAYLMALCDEFPA